MVDPKKVKVRDVWVIDPYIKFVIHTEDGSPFDAKIAVTVKIQGFNTYYANFSMSEIDTANVLPFVLPFQDPNWDGENSYMVDFTITLTSSSGESTKFTLPNYGSGVDRTAQ